MSDSEEPVTVEVARQLVDQARAEGVKLTGPGGLLGDLTKRVLETALEGEMEAHLGYPKHDPTGRDGGNSRNGTRPKTALTDVGPVEIGPGETGPGATPCYAGSYVDGAPEGYGWAVLVSDLRHVLDMPDAAPGPAKRLRRS